MSFLQNQIYSKHKQLSVSKNQHYNIKTQLANFRISFKQLLIKY